MRKLLLVVLLFCVLSGCGSEDIKCTYEGPAPDGIQLRVVESSVTSQGLEVRFINTTNNPFFTGQRFHLQQCTRGKWRCLDKEHIGFPVDDVAYMIPPADEGGEWSKSYGWNSVHGSLEKGNYRIIVKLWSDFDTTDYFVSADFSIP